MDPARRQAYLGALGVQAWVRRDRSAAASDTPAVQTESPAEVSSSELVATQPPVPTRAGGFPSEMLRAALSADAPVQPTTAEAEAPAAAVPATSAPVADNSDIAALDWGELADRVAGCRACELHRSRTQTVFGVGNRTARLMIIGEAPGADEDRQGEPFVGRAGQLLDAMLMAIGLGREQVYIANILKCRPPGNRNPEPAESAACRAFLDRQIALVQPDLILSLGAISAHNLLGTDLPVGKLRGRLHPYPATDAPVAVTYHPAYLLRRPEEKAKVWQDLQQVARTLRG